MYKNIHIQLSARVKIACYWNEPRQMNDMEEVRRLGQGRFVARDQRDVVYARRQYIATEKCRNIDEKCKINNLRIR